MTLFLAVAAAMLAAACAFVLVPLMRRRRLPREEAGALDVLRDQAAQLEAELARGELSADEYASERATLEARVLEEFPASAGASAAPRPPGVRTAIVLAATIPVLSVLLYLALGTPAALDPVVARAPADEKARTVSPQDIETMLERVRERLAREPDNLEGWTVLARTLYVLDRAGEAAQAFARASALAPQDATLLADWADALGVAQGRTLEGEPEAIIARALAADPTQWKANALAGTLAFDRKQYAKAIEHWERVRAGLPPGSPAAQSIEASLADARQRAAGSTGTASMETKPASARQGSAPAAIARVAGTVTLARSAQGVQPDDTLFVYARAASGGRMPLALLRAKARDLPLTFSLDDSMAMTPAALLSSQREVIVTARISRSGEATPQPGDLEVSSAPVKLGATGIALEIGR